MCDKDLTDNPSKLRNLINDLQCSEVETMSGKVGLVELSDYLLQFGYCDHILGVDIYIKSDGDYASYVDSIGLDKPNTPYSLDYSYMETLIILFSTF